MIYHLKKLDKPILMFENAEFEFINFFYFTNINANKIILTLKS